MYLINGQNLFGHYFLVVVLIDKEVTISYAW